MSKGKFLAATTQSLSTVMPENASTASEDITERAAASAYQQFPAMVGTGTPSLDTNTPLNICIEQTANRTLINVQDEAQKPQYFQALKKVIAAIGIPSSRYLGGLPNLT